VSCLGEGAGRRLQHRCLHFGLGNFGVNNYGTATSGIGNHGTNDSGSGNVGDYDSGAVGWAPV
jgi:hypothetical protein